ncbi:MAG: serine hydrolase domain-containing protein [Caldilineaceae bacterium]
MHIKTLIDTSYLARYVFLNAVDITDYQVFPARSIQNAPPPFHFSAVEHAGPCPSVLNEVRSLSNGRPRVESLDHFLTRTGTTAFLIIHKDAVLVEQYQNGCQRSSICTSFSVAKSVTSALVGIALHKGLLQRLDDPIVKYLPELPGYHWAALTLRQLVSMSSGLRYNAHRFFPWDDESRVYDSLNLRRLAQQIGHNSTRNYFRATTFREDENKITRMQVCLPGSCGRIAEALQTCYD